MRSKKPSSRRVLWIAFAIVLVDMLGVGILIPIIPLLFTDPSYPYHLNISAHTGYILLGVLTAIYPLMQFVAMPILGQLSDVYGRKPLLMLTLFGSGIAYALFAIGIITRNIPLLFVSRAIDGVTGASIAVAQAAIADTTDEDERISSFGFISAANGIGFILGPLVGAFLSESRFHHALGAPSPFWFAAIISILNMIAVIFFMPETHRGKAKKRIQIWQSITNIRHALTERGRRYLFITSFLFHSGFAFVITFFGVFLVYEFGFQQDSIGYIFAFVGFMLALTQIVVTGPLAKRVDARIVIPVALFVMAASLVGIYFAPNVVLLYVFVLPGAIAGSLILANLTGLVSTTSEERNHGSVLGVNTSVQSLAQAIPPLFAGAIAAIFAPTTPVLFAAGSIAAGAIVFTYYSRKAAF